MKNLNLYIIGLFTLILSACSTHQDFTSLKEYDDIYYQGDRVEATVTKPVQPSEDRMEGASDAERSYYQNVPRTEKEQRAKEKAYNPETEYYEEDYGNRIQNFHRENDGGYHYSSPYSTSPRMSMNFGYGMSPYYGSGFSTGIRFGTGFYDPFYSPWYNPYNPYYSMYFGYRPYYYDPFYYDPFYSYRYGYPYGRYYGSYYGYYPYGYYPNYGYYPYYGDYTGKTNITSTPRTDASSVRPSRGGVITDSNSNNSGRQEISRSPGTTTRGNANAVRDDQIQRTENTDLRRDDIRTREEVSREKGQTPATREQLNRSDYTRPGTTRNDYIRREQPQQATPMQRSRAPRENEILYRQSEPSRITAPAERSRIENINQNYNNQRQNYNQRQGIFNSPTRSSSPSYDNQRRSTIQSTPSQPSRGSYNYSSPSRGSSGETIGGGTNRSSSPSSTPTRGSRR